MRLSRLAFGVGCARLPEYFSRTRTRHPFNRLSCDLTCSLILINSFETTVRFRSSSSYKTRNKPKISRNLSAFDPRYKDPIVYGDRMAVSNLKTQNFDYFLVLDFEATCKEGTQTHPQEIIEFPVLKMNAVTLETDSIFHQYVEPKVNRELTPFCTQLTGIIQTMVDGQPHLEETLKNFNTWMEKENLLNPDVKSIFVTCGDWDLNKMITHQCDYFKIPIPGYFKSWINIKKAFAEVTSSYPKGMMSMLNKLDLQHEGRHHSGIDDCKNIANILCELLRRGYVAKATGSNL